MRMPYAASRVNLDALVAAVDRAVRTAGRPLPGLREAALVLRGDPGLLRAALAELRGDPRLLNEVAGRSYWHANGFAKVVLHAGDAFGVRLHIWPANHPPGRGDRPRVGGENPHNHRWDFASLLLTGTLREAQFSVADPTDGGTVRYMQCHYGREDGRTYLRPSEVTSLRGEGTVVRGAGSIDVVPRTATHVVAPVGADPVMTVVVQGPRTAEPVPVYVRLDKQAVDPQRPLAAEELLQLLGGVLDGSDALSTGSSNAGWVGR
jgi:hypothetical protein